MASFVHGAEDVLRVSVTLVGGATVPASGFAVVLRDGVAAGVHGPQVELRVSVALVGRKAIPSGGFTVVLRNAPTAVVHGTEGELRVGVTLVGREAIPSSGFTIVLRNAPTAVVHDAEGELRVGSADGEDQPPGYRGPAVSGRLLPTVVGQVLAFDSRYVRQSARDQVAVVSHRERAGVGLG